MSFSLLALAQSNTYKGVVLDEQGQPVIGASVVQKGVKGVGAVTDLDGNFTIKTDATSPLVISYVGYQNKEVNPSANMRIQLSVDNQNLGEVVVIGYGIQKKSVVTASIAKIDADELGKTQPVRVDGALKGLVAGVQVTTAGGQPGAASKIRIRGTGTVNNSDPLYIVDGMPIEGGIDYLNPADIESIEVLKDAASGAVYGARAANGVVLVTTKSGQVGKTRVKYDFSYGWQNPWRKRKLLNAAEYEGGRCLCRRQQHRQHPEQLRPFRYQLAGRSLQRQCPRAEPPAQHQWCFRQAQLLPLYGLL